MQDFTVFISNHSLLFSAAMVLLFLILIVEFLRTKDKTNLNPSQVTQMINRENAVIIDIRPHETYRNGHIINALSFSTQSLEQDTKKLEKFKNKPIIIVCTAGVESKKTTALLIKKGIQAYSLSGGMRAWVDAQLPIVKS